MNRVPKYKAWYKPLKVMIEPGNLAMINFDTKVLGVYLEMDGKGYHVLRMSDFELLQFSQVEDAEDNKLCAGDIIEFSYEASRIRAQVQQEGPGWLLASNDLDDGYIWISETCESLDGIFCIPGSKLLGNIYSNPELLEVSP